MLLCLSPDSVSLSRTASFVCLLTALVMSVGAEWDGVGVSILYLSLWKCVRVKVCQLACLRLSYVGVCRVRASSLAFVGMYSSCKARQVARVCVCVCAAFVCALCQGENYRLAS